MLYKNQTLLDIELETGISQTTATSRKIIVTKPDGTREEVTAEASTTKLTYAVPTGSTLFDQQGVYQFQGEFVIDGRLGLTEIVEKIFYTPL